MAPETQPRSSASPKGGAARDLFREMPRREPIARSKETGKLSPTRMSERVGGVARPFAVFRRLMAWYVEVLRYLSLNMWDRLRGRGGVVRRSERRRTLFTRLGPYASRLGKQLSLRLDLFPLETCNELAQLDDELPPPPLEITMAMVRESVGAPLHEVFSQIDPTPISSTTVGCVYQGVHHNGQRVIIRVRPPGAEDHFATEIRALSHLFGVLEVTSIVRPGFFYDLRIELKDMVNDELDFIGIARYHRLFRREVKRSKVKKIATARVYHDLSSKNVIVKDFMSGLWLSEVIGAVEGRNFKALARMEELDIDPVRLSRSMLEACWWGLFENYFFFSDPSPQNIVIRKGGVIGFTNLGNCSRSPSKGRRLQLHVYERLLKNDASGAAEAMVQWMAPLPMLDVDALSKTVEGRLWPRLFALRDREARWMDRSSIGVWRSLLKTMRERNATASLESVHMMRSAMLFDLIAARLNPRIKLLKEFERYQWRARRRSARRSEKSLNKVFARGARDAALSRLEEVTDGAERLAFWLETLSRDLPVKFMSMSNKGAYVASVALKFVGLVLSAVSLLAALALVKQWLGGEATSVWQQLGWLLKHPLVIVVASLVTLSAARRVALRLDDKDND